jgi:tetratricopeptide (TPR) repeat protein
MSFSGFHLPKPAHEKFKPPLYDWKSKIDSGNDIYIGREIEDAALRKAISGAPAKTPMALHAVGHFGVGRKTYLKNNLHKLFPRRFETFVEISIGQNQGIEEFYRQIYDLTVVSSLENTIRDFGDFATAKPTKQVERIVSLIYILINAGEFLIITDDGGVYTDDGDYQPHIKSVLNAIDGRGLPVFGVVQTRMMPAKMKLINTRVYHQYISTLSDENTRQLFGLTLKQLEIDYTDQQIAQACEHIDGHPFNVRFAAAFVHDYGLEALIADPSDLVDWKRKRAEDFLATMRFTEREGDILAALSEYRYLATEMIFAILDGDASEGMRSLRQLQEFSCVEQREGYCHIAPPIRDAVRRDPRFDRSDGWKQQLGRRICDAIADYKTEDRISIAILDSATLAVARGNKAPAFIWHLILPSHLLRIARDYYDRGKRADCIQFCERAWASKERLPYEAQLEVLRLWGLSTVRVGDEEAYGRVLDLFEGYTGRTAERLRLFVEGFYFRRHKQLDEAEKKFVAAWRISKQNQSVNRELANLLCKQRRYSEAEIYARDAYEQAPTNPFLIDVMAETLIGKDQQGMIIDRGELRRVMIDLERYGDAPGSSFFLVRKAQSQLSNGDFRGALETSDRAVDRTPGLVNAYFIRADARIALNDLVGADRDVTEINKLLDNAGGFSEGDEARVQELEIRVMIEKGLLRQAKEKIDRSAWIPRKVAERLRDLIAKAVNFDPSRVDGELKKWAGKRISARIRK